MKRGSKRISKPARKSNGERYTPLMYGICKEHGLPLPFAEYQFAHPRKWRFDFAWLEQRVALEIQGGLFVQGRHTRGAALLKEHEKLNTAAALGWRVLFVSPGGILTVVPQLVAAVTGKAA